MHGRRIFAFHEQGRVAIARQKGLQFGVRQASQDRGIGDLIAIEMQDREHSSIATSIEEFVAVPGCRERARFRFAVANDAGRDQVGIVQHGAEGMGQGITQFATFVDRTWCLWRRMAWYSAWKGELPEKPAQTGFVLRNIRIAFAIGALEIGVGDDPRRAVTGTGDEQQVQFALCNHAIEMSVDEVQSWYGAPMPQQSGLGMFAFQRLLKERIGKKINLTDRKVICGAPPLIQSRKLFLGERSLDHGFSIAISVAPTASRRQL